MYGKSFEIWLANLILIYRKRKRQFNDCVGYVKLCSFSPVIKEKTTKKKPDIPAWLSNYHNFPIREKYLISNQIDPNSSLYSTQIRNHLQIFL